MSVHQAVITCKCGKKYKHFSSYKKHFLSCISIHKSINQPLLELEEQRNNPSTAQEPVVSSSIKHYSGIKEQCPFCQLKINSEKLKNHINNICQQRFKNTPEYIELSKLSLITPGLTNKEIRAMCRVIQHLLTTGKFNPAQS
jgi:hypothetical protein